MKRILSRMLSLVLLLSFAACGAGSADSLAQSAPIGILEEAPAPTETNALPQDEYGRGVWYGFLPVELAQADPETATLTWRQFCDMLGAMIKAYKPEVLPEWEALTARAPLETIDREGGLLALIFAAKTAGLMMYNSDYIDTTRRFDYPNLDNASWDYPIFDWAEPVSICDDEDSNYLGIAVRFCARRISCITSEPLMNDVDGDGNLHLKNPLTLRDALTATVRLYESVESVAVETGEKLLELARQTQAGAEIIAAAEARKQEILTAETKIVKSDTYVPGETYTGTAYYVSNTGNDAADGLSPQTAWKTIERLAKVEFRYGDAIFFERGGLWRKAQMSNSIKRTPGLTLSAYGEGEKPRFYGSPENGGGGEKWSLYDEGADGRKIWRFYTEMAECSAIVLDESAYIKKDLFYWADGSYFQNDDATVPYAFERDLKDMEFFMDIPYNRDIEYANILYVQELNGGDFIEYAEGPLYVRCDAGNPGDLYADIEFCASYHSFDTTADHTALDNLCFRYCASGVAGGFGMGKSQDYITIQNSEAGWVGGKLAGFTEENQSNLGHVAMDGGGFNLNGSHETIRNCYTHHCFQEGIAIETFADDPESSAGNVLSDNVIEYTVMGLTAVNWADSASSGHTLTDTVIENNYVLYTGFESFYNFEPQIKELSQGKEVEWGKSAGALMRDSSALRLQNLGEGCRVLNNTFAFGVAQLMDLADYEPGGLMYEGNAYAVLPGYPYTQQLKNPYGPNMQALKTDGEAAIHGQLGDTSGSLVVLE